MSAIWIYDRERGGSGEGSEYKGPDVRVSRDATSVSIEISYSDHWDYIQARKPNIGDSVNEAGESAYVESWELTRKAGDHGTLRIRARREFANDTDPGDSPPEETIEVRWTQLEQAIETHPNYVEDLKKEYVFDPTNKGFSPVADDAFKRMFGEEKQTTLTLGGFFAVCKNANPRDRALALGLLEYIDAGGVPIVQKLLEKWDCGKESYKNFIPIIRKTAKTSKPPTSSDAGRKSSPPGGVKPSGFVWLKTADESTRTGSSGKWERTEEWTGFTEIDSDLYK